MGTTCPGMIHNITVFHICVHPRIVSLLKTLQTETLCVRGCYYGYFQNPPSQAASGPLPCGIYFAGCLVFVQAKVFPPVLGFLFIFVFFPHLEESAVSRFELPWGEFCGCLPVAMGNAAPASQSKSISCLLQERRLQEQSLSLSGSFGFTTIAIHKH